MTVHEFEVQQRKNILYKDAHLPQDAPENWRQYIHSLAEIIANQKWDDHRHTDRKKAAK